MNVITDKRNKIEIAHILINRIDRAVVRTRVTTLALANTALQRWTREVPEKGKSQCRIQLVFEDGFQYCGRIRLSRAHKSISLSRLLRHQLIAEYGAKADNRAAKIHRGGKDTSTTSTLPF